MDERKKPVLNTTNTLKIASRTGCLWRFLRVLIFFGVVVGVLVVMGEEAINQWKKLSSVIPYPYNWVAGGVIALIMIAAGFIMPILKQYVDGVKMNFWLYYVFYEFYVFSFLIIIFGGLAYLMSLIAIYDSLTYYMLLTGALGIFTVSCLLAMRGSSKNQKNQPRTAKNPPVAKAG